MEHCLCTVREQVFFVQCDSCERLGVKLGNTERLGDALGSVHGKVLGEEPG
jgi:hypothetical protein